MVRIAELNRKKVDVNVYLQSTWSSLSSFSPSPPPFPSPHYWQQQKQLEIFADIAAAWLAHAHVIFDFRLFRATPSLFALFRFQTARQSCSFSLSSVSILLCPSVSLSPCLSVCLSVCVSLSLSFLVADRLISDSCQSESSAVVGGSSRRNGGRTTVWDISVALSCWVVRHLGT